MRHGPSLLVLLALAIAACGNIPTPRPSSPLVPESSPSAAESLVPALTVDHPDVTVTPTTGLLDGQTVAVAVTGFGVGGEVRLSECSSAAVATDLGCGTELAAQTLLVTDETRAGSTSLVVHAEAADQPLVATPVSACADQCVVVATVGAGYGFAIAPIAFARTAGSSPTMPATTPSPAEVTAAAQAVDRYTADLIRGDYAAAFAMLAPDSPTRRGMSLAAYADERRLFFESVAGRFVVTPSPTDVAPITDWLGATYGATIDLRHAVLVEVTYPAIAQYNALSLYIVVFRTEEPVLYDVR